MNVWHLHRDEFHGNGVWGQMEGGGGLVFQTIENPATLIPASPMTVDGPVPYECVRDYYHRGDYPTFEIIVEGRDRLLIHAANYADELEGCIAPGMERGWDGVRPAVWRSRHAHALYMDSLVGEDRHLLIITEGE